MKEIFDIGKFNIISDEENYYFFRSLEPGDIEDIEKGIIKDGEKYTKLRTDRERWEEDNEGVKPRWNAESEVSLEEMFDHIKMHYSHQTNCISLSSNANVTRVYGNEFSDKYVMIKVPKREMGDSVFHAGEYMLREIEKRVEQAILEMELSDEIKQDLKEIDEATNSKEIQDLIKTRYTTKEEIDTRKSGMKKGIKYSSPHARISSFQSLDEEQSLEKNKIIGKLTVLERKANMPAIISNAPDNKLLIQTLGSAFASSEEIYYGDIPGERITEVSKEILDLFSLVQQVEGQDFETLENLKREVLKLAIEGKKIEIPEDSILKREDKVKQDITIEEMYNLTDGRVEYGMANSIVKNMFYLAKSQLNAREYATILREITNNNPKYEDAIKYIEKNGFEIEPEIITRRNKKGFKLSEAVNLNLKVSELPLVEDIIGLTEEEQIQILEKGGLSDTKGIITNTFSKIRRDGKISKEEYYAGAIIDLYDWENAGIEEFTIEQRNDFIEKLIEKDCVQIYTKLKEAGIPNEEITIYAINIASNENLYSILAQENYVELIQQNKEFLNKQLSIPQIENFLGYYNVEGTGIVLKYYQRNAVEKTDKIFENKRFASVLLPTGAGKTFVALTELNERKNEKMLYLAPQNEILEQTKDRIIECFHGKKETIGKSKDKIIAEVFPNLKFETYPGLLAERGNRIIEDTYDFIVFDELHRTGASEWEKKIDELLENQDENTKVLGITATPTRDVDDRNMADEMALKLGYTKEEVKEEEHIAIDMNLKEAIKLGVVVNPKLITCEYMLKNDGSMENLLEKINSIEDENVRKEKLTKYQTLRRNLDNAEGIPEILQKNIKNGEKYIIFIPVNDNGTDIEDEDGNKISRKTGKDKIKEYEQKMIEYLKDSGINPKFYSMLGAYSDKKNERQLKAFENDKSEDVKFMIVMNKANEGLHIDGIDGIMWFRALDENSKILYSQQLGRAIYSEEPNNPTPDEKRPKIFDFTNNTLRVGIDKEIKNNTRKDDLKLLAIVVDWVKLHNGLPNIDSTNKIEQRYAATLYRIQNKYTKYLNGFEEFPDLDEEKQEQIQAILNKGAEIDLWSIELSQKKMEIINKMLEVDTFEVREKLRDYVELENEVDGELNKGTVELVIEKLEKLQEIGVKVLLIQERDTIEKLAKKSNIRIERITELGLNPKEKIGYKVFDIIQGYRGKKSGIRLTEVQIRRILELGIILERKEYNLVGTFIEQIEKLKKIGVDASNIYCIDTIETLLKRQEIEIDKKEIERLGLKLDNKIGSTWNEVSVAYRKGKILHKLQLIGIDISKLKQRDTILTLANKSGIEIEKIKEIGLNPNEKIGKAINRPTDEQLKRLMQLGVDLEKKKSWIDRFINILESLQEIGIDSSKMVFADTIQTLANKSGIGIEKIKEIGLDPSYNIGRDKSCFIEAARGQARRTKPTQEQIDKLAKLGIENIIRDNMYDIFIEMLESLQNIGIDVKKLEQRDTIQKLAERSKVSIEKVKEIGLDPNYRIGSSLSNMRTRYKENEDLKLLQKIGVDLSKRVKDDSIGMLAEKSGIKIDKIKKIGLNPDKKISGRTPPTEEHVQKVLEFGLSLGNKKRTGKGYKTQEEIWNENYEILKGLLNAEGEYLGLTEKEVRKAQKQFKEKGYIPQTIKLKEEGQDDDIKIGKWLNNQRPMLNKYRGRTIEEIELDEKIDEEEKRRVIELLKLGVSFTGKELKAQELGQAGFETGIKDIELCDEVDADLKAKVEKEKEGGIKQNE